MKRSQTCIVWFPVTYFYIYIHDRIRILQRIFFLQIQNFFAKQTSQYEVYSFLFCYEIILETDFTSTHLIIYLTSKYNFKLLFMLALLVEHIFFTPFYGLYFNHQFVTHFFIRHPLELLPVLGPWERDRATHT